MDPGIEKRPLKMTIDKSYYAHPTAIVESEIIGEGTKIWHFAHVRQGSKIGKNCIIGKSVYIDIGAEIGNNVKVQNFVSVYRGVTIEDDVFVGPSVTFTNDLYPRAFIWDEEHVVPTLVSKGASIGANATLVCGITVGEYAMIGAGSLVAEDVPPFALILGNPGRQRGWVCYCGQRLKTAPQEVRGRAVYKCPACKRDVVIMK
jgi:UDP-2-acetamido-3-amino-2,3-dideoxy-glucuronate N-acetyltransferase